ncbi:hypothetical protein D9M70_603640 [compost metagenome]
MEERRAQGDPRQNLQWEHDLLHVVDVGQDQRGRLANALGKYVEHDQAGEKHHAELCHGSTVRIPAGLEDDAEDEGVDSQHHDRSDERPEHPHDGSPVTPQHLPLNKAFH